MRCGICSRVVRKTTLVHAPGSDGRLHQKRACSVCARTALVVVPIGGATRCGCGALATLCAACGVGKEKRDARKLVAPAVQRLRMLARAYQGTNEEGRRSDGLEQAADFLENGEW